MKTKTKQDTIEFRTSPPQTSVESTIEDKGRAAEYTRNGRKGDWHSLNSYPARFTIASLSL